MGIVENETGLSFANDIKDFYIDIEDIGGSKKSKVKAKQLGSGESTSSKDIIINNYF